MKRIFLLITFFVGSAVAALDQNHSGKMFSGFVKVRKDRELYVEYIKAAKGQPTIVLLNGLTYTTRQFDKVTAQLVQRGIGVFRYDFDGMGQTLLRYAPSVAPYPVKTQISDLKVLLEKMEIEAPYNLVGLSYGGGVGILFSVLYPELVNNVVLVAPYTQPLDGQDKWIKSQIWATRSMFPYNSYSDEELYDYFLHQIVYATYPQAEPIVLENPYKLEAIYNLVRGIRKSRPVDLANKLPAGTVHLIVAENDQYIPREVLTTFWAKVGKKAKMSQLLVKGVEHKISEVVPEFTASWLAQIVKGNSILFEGHDFEGNPYTGKVTMDGKPVKFGKE